MTLGSQWKTRRGSGEICSAFNVFTFRCFDFFGEAEGQKTALQSFCEQEGHKSVVQSYHFYGHLSIHYCLNLQHWPFALAMVPLCFLFCFLTEIAHAQVLG